MKKFTTTLITFISLIFTINAQSASTFINEINYLGSNPTQGIEVAGQAGQDLTGWSIASYAADGTVDYIEYLSGGVIPNQQNGYGSIWYDVEQGSNAGGVALVNPNGGVVQFLSYGTIGFVGTIIHAVDGPAGGMVSDFVGVQLFPGSSLQLTGIGLGYLDFIWGLPLGSTPGSINTNQLFGILNLFGILGLSATENEMDLNEADLTVTIYPNPTTDFVRVDIPNTKAKTNCTLEIFDAQGRRLQAMTVNADQTTTVDIDLSQYDLGTYFLRWSNGETQVTKSIIKT